MDSLRIVCRFLAVLVFLWPLTGFSADAERFFDQTLGDYPAELLAARKAGKLGVLVMFETEACPYCRRMRRDVLSRDDVQGYFRRHFAVYSVDILGDVPLTEPAGRETTEKGWARQMRVAGTPTFVFLDPDGRELARYVGATRDTEEFLQLGRYVVEGHHRQQTFPQFYPASRPERRKP